MKAADLTKRVIPKLMSLILDKKFLYFVTAPNLEQEKFKKQLSDGQLELLEEIRLKIRKDDDVKTTGGFSSLIHCIKREAINQIVQYQAFKMTSKEDSKGETSSSEDELFDLIFFGIKDLVNKGVSLCQLEHSYIYDALSKAIENLIEYLKKNTALASTLESYSYDLQCFAAIYAGEELPSKIDDSNVDYDEPPELKLSPAETTPVNPEDNRINNIMVTILDRNILQLMSAPSTLPQIFKDFQKIFAAKLPNTFQHWEKMNSEVRDNMAGVTTEFRTAFMQGIPDIYKSLKIEARKIIESDRKQKGPNQYARIAEVNAMIDKMLKTNTTQDGEHSIPDSCIKSIKAFTGCLKTEKWIINILEKHLWLLPHVALIFSGEYNIDEVDDISSQDEEKTADPCTQSSSTQSGFFPEIKAISESTISSSRPNLTFDSLIKKIINEILNGDILKFMCSLFSKFPEYEDFKSKLPKTILTTLEEMYISIQDCLNGDRDQFTNGLFEIYQGLITQAEKQANLEERLKKKIPLDDKEFKTEITDEKLDAHMEDLIVSIQEQYINNNLNSDQLDYAYFDYISPKVLASLNRFKQCLDHNSTLTNTLDSHLGQIDYFSKLYVGKIILDPEIHTKDNQETADEGAVTLSPVPSSSSSSSSASVSVNTVLGTCLSKNSNSVLVGLHSSSSTASCSFSSYNQCVD